MPFITCPKCDHEAVAPRELVGLEWTCPKCHESTLVVDDVQQAVLRNHARNSPGPWIVLGTLILAGVFGIGFLIVAVSKSGRETNSRRAAATIVDNQRISYREEDHDRWGERTRYDESERSDSLSFGQILLRLVALIFGTAFYMAPSLIALARGHNNVTPILVVNFFLGWALVGWVIALAWAFTDLKHVENRRRSFL